MAVFKMVQNSVKKWNQNLLTKTSAVNAILNRDIFPDYKRKQIERWKTEGESEDESWDALNPTYSAWKRRVYSGYPYAGARMMVATGLLLKQTVQTPKKVVRNGTMFITITANTTARERPVGLRGKKLKRPSRKENYAKFANEARNFTHFGSTTRREWRKMVAKEVSKLRFK
jgi:hypothetical protein